MSALTDTARFDTSAAADRLGLGFDEAAGLAQTPAYDLPDVHVGSAGYALTYCRRTIPLLLRRHRLHPGDRSLWRAGFALTADQMNAWDRLFGVPASATGRLTQSNVAATLILMGMMAEFGVNFRHVRHLGTSQSLASPRYCPSQRYTVLSRARPPVRLRDDRVGIETVTRIVDDGGNGVAAHVDRWFVGNVPSDDVAHCTQGGDAVWSAHQSRRGAGRTDSLAHSETIAIRPGMGTRYAFVSGDLNPTHIGAIGRLLGHRSPFIQGFCTTNLLIAKAHAAGLPIDTIDVDFLRPVFEGRTYELCFDRQSFQLLGPDGKPAAAGTWGMKDEASCTGSAIG